MAMMQPAVPEAEQALATKQAVSPGGRSSRRTALTGLGFVLPFLIMYALFLLWPIILGLRMSFFNWSLVGKGASDFAGLANYGEALADPAFSTSLWHTILFTIISTPILVVLGSGWHCWQIQCRGAGVSSVLLSLPRTCCLPPLWF